MRKNWGGKYANALVKQYSEGMSRGSETQWQSTEGVPMLKEAVCGRCIYARVFIHGSSGTGRVREVHSCKGIYSRTKLNHSSQAMVMIKSWGWKVSGLQSNIYTFKKVKNLCDEMTSYPLLTGGGGFYPWDNNANVGAISFGYFHASYPFKTSPKWTGRFELVPRRCSPNLSFSHYFYIPWKNIMRLPESPSCL